MRLNEMHTELGKLAGEFTLTNDPARPGTAKSRWDGDARLTGTNPTALVGNDADNVLVCAPQEGIFLAMHSLLSPGDRVVVTLVQRVGRRGGAACDSSARRC